MGAKVFHCADLHYQTDPPTLKWIRRAMATAVEQAIAERCDLAVIAGDSFHHAISVHEPAFFDYVQAVLSLSRHMPVVILQGTHSHDRPGSLDVFKAIADLNHEILVADQIGSLTINGICVSWLPSLNKAAPEIMSEGANAWTVRQLAGFAERHTEMRANGVPTVLVTHGTVSGCQSESGYAMVSPDHEFSLESLSAAEADAVLMGHIHKHQSWRDILTPAGNRTTIAYSGSITRLVANQFDPVGFLIWDIEPGRADFQFHEVPSRQLIRISSSGPPNMDDLRRHAAEITRDDVVVIAWDVDEEHAGSVNQARIRELFSGAESVKLAPHVNPIQRVREEGIDRIPTYRGQVEASATNLDGEGALAKVAGVWEDIYRSGEESARDVKVRIERETKTQQQERIAA